MPVETIIAKRHSDFGVMIQTPEGDTWMNGAKGMPTKKDKWQTLIPAGKPTVVEYFVTDKGARRITKVVSNTTPQQPPAPAVTSAEPAPTQAPVTNGRTQYGRPLSAYEAEKDVRIHVSGVLQAVISSPALAALSTSQAEYVENVKAVTAAMLDFAAEEITKRNTKAE